MWKRIILAINLFVLSPIIAFGTGLLGLLMGSFVTAGELGFRYQLDQPQRFVMVGSMHNFSYLGGLLGLIIAGFWMARKNGS